jgi:hypothetical protein
MSEKTYTRSVKADLSLVWLAGEVKTPPFSLDARIEAGMLLRRLQRGEKLALPHSLPEALLLLLAAAVQRCEADVALLHDVRDDGAIVVCSHGERMFEMLGNKLAPRDPSLLAAMAGNLVLAEPESGSAGRAIRGRLSRLGRPATAAFMLPVQVRGRLLALLEIGRQRPFLARDVAAGEALVDALVQSVEGRGWAAQWLPGEGGARVERG